MTDVTLHPAPRWRAVLAEQIRTVGSSLVREGLVLAVVLALGTVVIVGEIVRGGPGFDSDETLPTALIAFFVPFAVWRGQKRFGPAFLWTLPFDRRRLALTRVLAGLVWLMVGVALFAAWLVALGLLAHASPARMVARIPFTATVIMYLFGSALVLGLRHPLRWLLGVSGVFFLVGTLSDLLNRPNDGEWQYIPGAGVFFSAVEHALASWLTLPAFPQWLLTTLITLGAGLAAVWAAASRHKENR